MAVDEVLLDALNAIPCSRLGYDEWTTVGMALKSVGCGCETWDEWSASDTKRYHEGECAKKWKSFDADRQDGVGGGTIVRIAERFGWARPEQKVFGWDEELVLGQTIRDDGAIYPRKATVRQQTPMERYGLPVFKTLPEPCPMDPLGDLEPAEMLRMQLKAMFRFGEFVNIVPDKAHMGGETREGERFYHYADKLLGSVKDGGAYICVNPVTSEGRKDDNVTAYRYALVECDELPKARQLELIRRLQLPCVAVVDSGNNSVHAIVRIDAANAEQHRERVQALYDFCDANGLKVDRSCKNASRLTRLAGAMRDGHLQELVAVNVGPKSWGQFVHSVRELAKRDEATEGHISKPTVFTLGNAIVMPNKAEHWAIEGVAEYGDFHVTTGETGSGKTHFLEEESIAFATGGEFIGYRYTKSNVILIDPEMRVEKAQQRIKAIAEKMGPIDEDDCNRLRVVCTRTAPQTADELKSLIGEIYDQMPPSENRVLLVDSISVVISADEEANENDNGYMNRFANIFKQIAETFGCFIHAMHHPGKYAGQTYARTGGISRGAEAFNAAPDIVSNLVPLYVEEGSGAWELIHGEGERMHWRVLPSAVRLVYTKNRYTRPAKDVNMLFIHPCHEADATGELELCDVAYTVKKKKKPHEEGGECTEEKYEIRREACDEKLAEIVADLEKQGVVPDKDSPLIDRLREWQESQGYDKQTLGTVKRWIRDGKYTSVMWDKRTKKQGGQRFYLSRTDGEG